MRTLLGFAKLWRNRQMRDSALGEYTSLTSKPLLLADIAWRGGLYEALEKDLSAFEAGRLHGRRQIALEILELANATPAQLKAITTRALKEDPHD